MGSRIFPDPMHVETKVQIVLPPEATALLRDLHHDRQGIALGGLVMVGCIVALTLKRLLSR